MNDFNSALRDSLLTPQRQRQIATMKEVQIMDRQKRQKKSHKLQTSVPAFNRVDNGTLPIINVGTLPEEVDFQEPRNLSSAENHRADDPTMKLLSAPRLQGIHKRYLRNDLESGTSQMPTNASRHLQGVSSRKSNVQQLNQPSMDQDNTTSSSVWNSKNLPNQLFTPRDPPRKVSPLIREHLRSAS